MCKDLLIDQLENMFMYIALAIFTIYLLILMRNRKKLPPGPWSLPIVGYLPWLDPKEPYKTLQKLAKKYGPVYGIYMGNIYTVVLSDTKIIRKVFSKDETTGRAPLYLTHGLMKGYGIICSEGELWKNQRKFVYGCLRQFGGTKVGSHTTMENLIKKHALEFTDYVSSLGNSASIIPSEHLRHYLGSFMTTIVFGECWSKDDETWKYLQHLQEEGIKHIGIAGPLNFIPILRFLPMFKKTVKFLTEGLEKTHKIYDGIIEKHQETLREKLAVNSDYAPQNFLDAFLLEREKKHNSSEAKFYSDQQMKYLLADMFGAGLDTTLTTLNWYILYIAIHTDFQKKVREELESVLEGKTASMKDFQYLPFFEASIAEVQRIRSTVPIGIPHGTLCDIDINGFIIPSNTMVVPLLWAVHMDDKAWKDPDNFNPYRFLDENGKFFKPEHFIPFQIGKRMCVGDELAKMLLYFFCSIILQIYELSVDNIKDIDLRGKCGITLTSIDHKITFRKY
ncbi:hypothetical protein WA026_008362 [Henosepilachna vigintioctopunctata]|uniref:Cytochrome P450 n=1 Tax=Henosepilachna vigintioctopunctata TaxID=420089 RepID=A0AAW1UH98_9CUCU